jgi:hypothetical protein
LNSTWAYLAHHSALQVNIFTLTHRGNELHPNEFFVSVQTVLGICLGVQQLRQLSVFEVHEGGDYGILWPLVIAGIWVAGGPIRPWILELLLNWPREGMLVTSLLRQKVIVGSDKFENLSRGNLVQDRFGLRI